MADDAVFPWRPLVLIPGQAAGSVPTLPKPVPRARRAYRLRVQLMGIEPTIWRTIEVLGATTLRRLHRVIQEAMGWQDYHLYGFYSAPPPGPWP